MVYEDKRPKEFNKIALPEDLRAREIKISDNARTVLQKRYIRKDASGAAAETEQEMFWRVAYHVALAESELGGSAEAVEKWARKYYELLTELRFFPNSPTFTGAGTPLGQLAACFVLAIDDDMGRTGQGIFETLRHAALIQQTGGGNGFSFSNLRPRGAIVKSSSGAATGPVGFLRVYDQAFGEIAQGGCLTPETLVFTDEGLLRLDEIVSQSEKGWRGHELQIATDEGWRASYQGYNNGVGRVLRITTQDGLQLTGTPDHKLKVMSADGPVWRRFDELQADDALMVVLGQHSGHMQPLSAPQRAHGNQLMPLFPQILDESFAFFLGYMMGDGFMAAGADDHRLGVSVAHDSYLMEAMPRLMAELFGDHLSIHRGQKPNDASVTYTLDNRALKDFFALNRLDKAKSQAVRVPKLIRQSPPQVVAAFLRGLFEADGALSHGYPQLLSSSEDLIREVAALLIGLGCPIRISQLSPSKNRFGTAPMWQVKIQSHRGLQIWQNYIGCESGSRFEKALNFQPNLNRETNDVLPHPNYWLEPILNAITLPQIDRRGRGVGRKLRATQPELRRNLLRYTRGERQLTASGYTNLSEQYIEFADHARPIENLWFTAISTIEEAGEALTLDLEVIDNHTYLASGIVSHNSRRGANMAVLSVDHPDIRDFIRCKTSEGAIENFNISVGITDAFMQAVENDTDFELINPHNGTVAEVVRARELFDMIVEHAHHNGEPGVLFLDTANKENPVPHLYRLESTNPCFVGETRIPTEYGLLRADELAEMGLPMFIAADNRAPLSDQASPNLKQFGVALRPASPVWITRQNTPVMKLTTKGGYQITATPDHKFLTTSGYVALQDLQPDDKLLIQSGEGVWSKNYRLPNVEHMRETMAEMAFGGDHASGNTIQRRDFQTLYSNLPETWSHDLGLVLGWLVGDGWLSLNSGSPVGMVFGKDDCLSPVHQAMTQFFGAGHLHDRGSLKQLTYGRVPLAFFLSLGVLPVRAHEKRVPAALWSAPREAVIGFLQGLFSADGTVHLKGMNRDCTVRLASSSPDLLRDVQILLANFGIAARIYQRRKAGEKPMPDGKGGLKTYSYQAQYEIIIGRANRDRFTEMIGFIDPEKQAKVEAYLESKRRASVVEHFIDPVLSVEPAGHADVYDLSQEQTHSLIANGYIIHNCGEQFLGPFENCCLGSVNLAQHYTEDGRVDWAKLQESIELSTRFLDHVVTANAYVPAVPQLREAAERVRRIGLGIMGLGDLMYAVGVRYGSVEGQEFASQIMEFVRYHSMRVSIELAKQHGPFLAIEGSRYDPNNLQWTIPQPLVPHVSDWERPKLNWDKIEKNIKKHGIRNGATNTVAPTGTIATVSGCEGYGCEPVFALAYMRYMVNNAGNSDDRIPLQYTSPLFEKALQQADLPSETINKIIEQVNNTGTCQGIPELPEHLQNVFVVAGDISADEHIRMQAAMQAFTDNAISKTINMKEDANLADVAEAYMLGWKLGCKGLTVYVTGSREKVVLETKATLEQKQKAEQALAQPATPTQQLPLFNEEKKPRPRHLAGKTYRSETPAGTTYITINENGYGQGQPFEVFIHTAKAGSEVMAIAEAIGRLISYTLRLSSPVSPRKRLKEIVRQLSGIGGSNATGFGPYRVRSLPDGLAQVLQEYISESDNQAANEAKPRYIEQPNLPLLDTTPPQAQIEAPRNGKKALGDICPSCGSPTLIYEEGCEKCYSCGFSKC